MDLAAILQFVENNLNQYDVSPIAAQLPNLGNEIGSLWLNGDKGPTRLLWPTDAERGAEFRGCFSAHGLVMRACTLGLNEAALFRSNGLREISIIVEALNLLQPYNAAAYHGPPRIRQAAMRLAEMNDVFNWTRGKPQGVGIVCKLNGFFDCSTRDSTASQAHHDGIIGSGADRLGLSFSSLGLSTGDFAVYPPTPKTNQAALSLELPHATAWAVSSALRCEGHGYLHNRLMAGDQLRGNKIVVMVETAPGAGPRLLATLPEMITVLRECRMRSNQRTPTSVAQRSMSISR